jgi:hypothetical protein
MTCTQEWTYAVIMCIQPLVPILAKWRLQCRDQRCLSGQPLTRQRCLLHCKLPMLFMCADADICIVVFRVKLWVETAPKRCRYSCWAQNSVDILAESALLIIAIIFAGINICNASKTLSSRPLGFSCDFGVLDCFVSVLYLNNAQS